MHAKFVVVEPNLQPHEYELDLPATIGRGDESQIRLDHFLISRCHCELYEDRGQMMVRDLGSRNGTFIKGQRIESAPLASGELLNVGGITLCAIYGDDAIPVDSQRKSDIDAAGVETLTVEDTVPVSVRANANLDDVLRN